MNDICQNLVNERNEMITFLILKGWIIDSEYLVIFPTERGYLKTPSTNSLWWEIEEAYDYETGNL